MQDQYVCEYSFRAVRFLYYRGYIKYNFRFSFLFILQHSIKRIIIRPISSELMTQISALVV